MARYKIDTDHTVVGFTVMNMDVAWVRGQFNIMSGQIDFDPTDLAKLSADIAIEATGIYTGVAKRDEHLRSPDFLNAAAHPTITFKSTKAEAYGCDRARLTGNLTIRGVTRPVVLEMEYRDTVKAPQGETTAGFCATTVINRLDWGIKWNVPMELGRILVGNDVHITVDMEADLAE